MEDLLKQTTEGQDRHQKQRDRENEYFSRVLEEADKEESENKKRRLKEIEEEAMRTEDPKRTTELYDEYMNEYKNQKRSREGASASSRGGVDECPGQLGTGLRSAAAAQERDGWRR